MKVLLDENVPRPLRRHLTDHSASTVQEMGWAGVKNGTLLNLAESHGFDVLVTFDRNIEFQQNLTGRTISVAVIIAASKKIETLLPLISELLALLPTIEPGRVYRVEKT